MTQEQTQTEAPVTDTPEDGSLDAAVLALQKRGEAETPEQDAKPADEQAEADTETEDADPAEEAEQGQPEEDTAAESALVEVEYEGKKYEVPPELEKALLRQADYSRKMNDVSANQKAAEKQVDLAKTLVKGAAEYAEVMAEARIVEERIKQFEAIDWATLRAENPAEYAAQSADFQTLRLARSDTDRRMAEVQQKLKDGETAEFSEKRQAMLAKLSKDIKGWGDEMGASLTTYAETIGMQRETLERLTDPAVVVALEKARKYDDLQKAKMEIVRSKIATAKPVMKPGAQKPVNQNVQAIARFNQTRSDEDAIAALRARNTR